MVSRETDFGMPRLVLEYRHQGRDHTAGLRVLHGVDPLDAADMEGEANRFANALKLVLPNTAVIFAAHTQSRYGLKLIEIAFAADIVGIKGTYTGASDYKSLTGTVAGRSTTVGSSGHVGHTLLRWHLGHAYHVNPGEQVITLATVDTTGGLLSYLTDSLLCFGDFYGNKCQPKRELSLQYNAYIQRKYGT